MKHPYFDILLEHPDREPLWWDEAGVPRYIPFEPGHANNAYADEVALVEVTCQACGRRMRVVVSQSNTAEMLARIQMGRKNIHVAPLTGATSLEAYGDPPCFAIKDGEPYQCWGSTAPPHHERIVEFWRRAPRWERVPKEEGISTDDLNEFGRVLRSVRYCSPEHRQARDKAEEVLAEMESKAELEGKGNLR